jgi:aminocarboxymuconate-semialdehyde decarboxylase
MTTDGSARSGAPVIDVHWHHVPKSLAEAIVDGRCRIGGEVKRDGDKVVLLLGDGFKQPLPPRLVDAATIPDSLARAGVDVAAASLAPPMSHYWADPEVALEVSRFANDGLAEVAEASGGRILPLANVPLQDVALAVQETRRAADDLHFRGVALGSNAAGTNLGDDQLLPFWETVRERDLFVFVHGLAPLGKERLKQHQLSNFVGLPIDTAVAVGSMVLGGLFERLPGLKVCFSHGGGAFPCLLGRWDHGYRERLAPEGTTIRLPSEYLADIYCDSLTHDQAGLRYLVERVGPGHVLLGSDHPFDMGEPDPVGQVKAAIEDEAVRAAILGETAARLLQVGG